MRLTPSSVHGAACITCLLLCGTGKTCLAFVWNILSLPFVPLHATRTAFCALCALHYSVCIPFYHSALVLCLVPLVQLSPAHEGRRGEYFLCCVLAAGILVRSLFVFEHEHFFALLRISLFFGAVADHMPCWLTNARSKHRYSLLNDIGRREKKKREGKLAGVLSELSLSCPTACSCLYPLHLLPACDAPSLFTTFIPGATTSWRFRLAASWLAKHTNRRMGVRRRPFHRGRCTAAGMTRAAFFAAFPR